MLYQETNEKVLLNRKSFTLDSHFRWQKLRPFFNEKPDELYAGCKVNKLETNLQIALR